MKFHLHHTLEVTGLSPLLTLCILVIGSAAVCGGTPTLPNVAGMAGRTDVHVIVSGTEITGEPYVLVGGSESGDVLIERFRRDLEANDWSFQDGLLRDDGIRIATSADHDDCIIFYVGRQLLTGASYIAREVEFDHPGALENARSQYETLIVVADGRCA